MALTRYEGDIEIIRDLPPQPNDTLGMSAADLQAEFDKFASEFTTFFNLTHVPEVETAINNAAAGIGMLNKLSGSVIQDGTITTNKLSQAANAQAVDTNVVRDGAITMAKLATAVQTILNSVGGKTTHITLSVSLYHDDWSNNTQTVTVEGAETDNVIIATGGTDNTSHTAWSNNDIHVTAQAHNSLTFACRSVPDAASVTVNILILN